MKRNLFPLLCGIALALGTQAQAQNQVQLFGPPSFTGGTTPATWNQALSFAQQPAEENAGQMFAPLVQEVFPNPSSDQVHLILAQPVGQQARVACVNMNGEMLLTESIAPGRQEVNMDVSSLPEGYYALQFQEQGQAPESLLFLKAAE